MRLISLVLMVVVSLPVWAEEDQGPPPQVLITNVNVWDGTSNGLTKPINVLVENNLVKKVRADHSDAHGEATVIDGQGKVLIARPDRYPHPYRRA